MKLLSTFLIFISFLNLANCRMWNKSPIERAEWITKKIISDLDLDNSQQELIQKIKSEWIVKHIQGRISATNKEELLNLIKSEKIDEVKYNKITQEMQKNRIEMYNFMNSKFLEFHASLRPDQKRKLADRVDTLLKKFGHDIP